MTCDIYKTGHLALVICALTMGTAVAADTKSPPTESSTAAAREPRSRKFKFYYAADISELKPGTKARVWVPVPSTSPEQTVKFVKVKLPGEAESRIEKKFRNSVLYFEATANEQGLIPIEIEYLAERFEVLPKSSETAEAEQLPLFLAADNLVPTDDELVQRLFPTDRPSGKPSEIAYQVYQRVGDHMKYDKSGEGWGRGDSRWACNSRYGNCTDFHSLFISLCRNLKVPAKFEIGFPLPEGESKGEIPGYHCWAKFADGGHWLAVDISEADKHPEMKEYYFGSLTPDRLVFSTGRDLELVPEPKAGPVNFLIYPYVEVDGQPHTKLVKKFRFEDVEK